MTKQRITLDTPNVDRLISYLGQGLAFHNGPLSSGISAEFLPRQEPSITVTWHEQAARETIGELALILRAIGRTEFQGIPLDCLTEAGLRAQKSVKRRRKYAARK